MHPGVEKLEQLFNDAQKNPSAIKNFYDTLWLTGGMLPRAELRTVVEKVYEWQKLRAVLEQQNFALANVALGFVCYHEGKFDEAIIINIKTQKLFNEINDTDGASVCSVMIGNSYRSLGEIEFALKYLLEGYQHLSKIDSYAIFLSFCIYNLAEIYSETNQYEDALRFHQMAEQQTKMIGNKTMLARTYDGMGVVYQHQKKYSMALEYLTKSLQLTQEVGNRPVEARALTDLGCYYFEMGDYAKAIEFHRRALAIREELKIPNAAITNLVHLGEIYKAQGKMDEAIDFLNKALRIAEEMKVKLKAYQVHQLLSDIYQAKGDTAQSFFHYKAYHEVREEVLHDDNEKKMRNLQLIFEAEQTKMENEIIKAQKAEIERKNFQLQQTIDELTLTKVSKKAKTITLVIAIVLFIAEEFLLNAIEGAYASNNYFLSLAAKCAIVLSLKPIEKFVEHYLLSKIMRAQVPVAGS